MSHQLPPRHHLPHHRRVSLILGALILVALALAATPVLADPLDQVTGMEGWGKTDGRTACDEWKEWRRLRGQWRSGCREGRVQRRIYLRLTRLLRQPVGPSFTSIRQLLRR